MPTLTQDRPTVTEPLQPQEPHTILVTIEDGTVDWVYTDLNVRVIVIEPDLLPVDLDQQVREVLTLSLKDAKLPRAIKGRLKKIIFQPEREVTAEQGDGGR